MPTITQQLIDAIEQSGQTRYAISQACGVNQGTLSRFVNGKAGVTTETVDRLCAHLGLELRPISKRRKR